MRRGLHRQACRDLCRGIDRLSLELVWICAPAISREHEPRCPYVLVPEVEVERCVWYSTRCATAPCVECPLSPILARDHSCSALIHRPHINLTLQATISPPHHCSVKPTSSNSDSLLRETQTQTHTPHTTLLLTHPHTLTTCNPLTPRSRRSCENT